MSPRPEALDRPLLWDDEYAFVDPAEVVDELVARATAGPLYVDRLTHDDRRTGPPPRSFLVTEGGPYKRRPRPAWSLDDPPPPPRTPADPTPVYLDPAGTVWQPTRDGLDEVTRLPTGTLPAAG